jgi:hypothetical protein
LEAEQELGVSIVLTKRERFAMRVFLLCLFCAGLLLGSSLSGQEIDTDGDGLSDFHETHKYFTDPNKFSTTGDGVSDGDWQRRREFAYTVRSVIKVMEPVNVDCLNDNYQDAQLLSRSDNYVELEVIHYPLNTVAEAITGNPNWRNDARALAEYLRPGVTTNWDEGMQRELRAALKADGIDPDQLDDKEFVIRVSRWLFSRSQFINMFCTHYVEFVDGQPIVPLLLKAKFESDKGDPGWTVEQQFEHELFGRSMFANRCHGTCTSTAVYLTTVLRAVGIPTRMVLALPLVDATDTAQLSLVENNLTHHRARRAALLGLASAKGYSNHTFNEVFVGGRWVRLNSSHLGQNILDSHLFGILTHVHTFGDLSEARLAATWGKRYALGERDAVFQHGNPYRTVELSDHFGKFARIDNPDCQEHKTLTLSKAYWLDSADAPVEVKQSKSAKMDPTAGYVVAHIDEWFPDESYSQYRIFLQGAAKEFLFRAAGQEDIRGRYWGTITSPPDVHEVVISITSTEFGKMKPDVGYLLVPQSGSADKEWTLRGEVTIQRDR